jgi:hypothetical protein
MPLIRIEKYFTNHFSNKNISNGRLKAFTDDHINKTTGILTVSPNAIIQQLLDDLLPLYNGYFGAISSEATKYAIQQSRTIAVNNAWEKVLDFIRQKEGTVKGIWGKDAEQYQEFYPLGVEEYNKATKINKSIILTRYLDAATTHQATLGAPFLATFTNLKTDWENKFTTQQLQIGLVKDAASQRDNNRKPIELQLTRNILGIAGVFAGKPEMVNDYFNQSLLRYPSLKASSNT